MKIITIAFIAAGLWCAAVRAADPAPQPPKPANAGEAAHPRQTKFWEAWKLADTDGDGVISRQEYAAMKRVETLPADKREELFKRLDKDGDGGISREELGEIIKHRLGKHQLMPRLQELDTDHNGSINFEEFKAGEFFKKLPPERQAALFKRLDENGDGGISPRDHPADRPGPPHDPHHGFMMLDKNRDGFLTFDEFRQSMFVRKLPEAEQKERFDKLDRNQDAKLDATEFTHPEHKGEGKPDPQPQRTEAVPK